MKKIILAVAVAAVATMALVGSASAGGGTGITATPAATKTWAGHSHRQVRPFGERDHQRDEPSQLGRCSEPVDERGRVSPVPSPYWSQRTRQPDAEPELRPERARHGSIHISSTPTQRSPGHDSGLLHRTEPVQRVCLSGQPAGRRLERSIQPCWTVRRLPCPPGSRALPDRRIRHVHQPRPQRRRCRVREPPTTGRRISSGYDVGQFLLGEGFGDVQVNGNFVDWGAHSASHAYGLSTMLSVHP